LRRRISNCAAYVRVHISSRSIYSRRNTPTSRLCNYKHRRAIVASPTYFATRVWAHAFSTNFAHRVTSVGVSRSSEVEEDRRADSRNELTAIDSRATSALSPRQLSSFFLHFFARKKHFGVGARRCGEQ